jgi:hypothetical protein
MAISTVGAFTALDFAIRLLDRLPGFIAAGVDVTPLMSACREKLRQFKAEDRNPTAEEWDQQEAEIAAVEQQLREALHDEGDQ